MLLNLVGSSVFWLGGPAIVTFDPQRTDLVESLQGELSFCGVFPGPAAMYGTISTMNENGDITVRFYSAVGPEEEAEEVEREAYDFYIPKGMYIVVMRRR